MRLTSVTIVCGLWSSIVPIVAAGCTFTHGLNELQTGLADASGNNTDVQADAGLAYPPHTIAITGDNHFDASEIFPTSAFAYQAYIAWDRDYFYYGIKGPSIESDDAAVWVLAYWGTTRAPGMSTRRAQTYGNQTPTLNFDANYHVRWKGDDTFTSLMRFSPGGWQDGVGFPGRHQRKGRFVEFSLPLKAIFAPGENATRARFVLAVIHEGALENTYASVPQSAIVPDGAFNPPYQHSFEFDLTGGTLPNQHPAQ